MFKIETRYALHAMVVLAQSDQLVPNPALSERLSVSLPMVAKIMNRLGQGGLVNSRSGPGGGYRLSRPAENINLMDVVALTEGHDWGLRCILGLPNCGDDQPCAMHNVWGKLRDNIRDMLTNHSVADMANGVVDVDLKVVDGDGIPDTQGEINETE
jgi:Rrf2 family transcriptional regulator, iron-sulfur cluster assembly transcription factor